MALLKSLLVLVLLIGELYGEPKFPPLNNSRVVDEASLFDLSQKSILEQKLADYERNSSNQIVIVTLKSLDGYDISDYGYQLGRHWGIGQAKKNNGVLLIIAPNERKVRIEVGYGLEGALNDATANTIIQKDILPFFKSGNYYEGTGKGIDSIIKVTKGEYTSEPRKDIKKGSIFEYLMPILFLFIMISNIFFKKGSARKSKIIPALVSSGIAGIISWVMFAIIPISIAIAVIIFLIVLFGHLSPLNSYNSRSGGDFGGFSRSSGSFGGFSGGGGSFGGGGASGSW
ncbi:MAG: TPM domain-containing protein [Sulfurovaceae bacterium]